MLRLQGIVGLAIVAALVFVAIGFYTHSFSRTVTVQFVTPQSAELLAPGSPVRLRGVEVGRVDTLRATGSDAHLTLALYPDKAQLIPADVHARITSSTIAGAPHVELVESRPPTATGPITPIAAGVTIPALDGPPGINELFDDTFSLLQDVRVDELNTTLSTLAAALDGRGEELGQTLSSLSSYVRDLNEHGPTLARDIDLAASVLPRYAELSDELLEILSHSTVTAETLVVRSGDLHDLLNAAGELSEAGIPLIEALEEPLASALRLLDPVTGLLADYSPIFSCVLGALEHQARNNVSLGVEYPGAQAIMTLLPGQRGYRYPDDLPQYVDDRGPDCLSLPALEGAEYPLPYRRYNDNSNINLDGTPRLGIPPLSFFPPPVPAEPSGDGVP